MPFQHLQENIQIAKQFFLFKWPSIVMISKLDDEQVAQTFVLIHLLKKFLILHIKPTDYIQHETFHV